MTQPTWSLSQLWARLPVAGSIAIVIVPVIIILITVVVVTATARDEKSYQAGRELSRIAQITYKGSCNVGLPCTDGPDRTDAVTPEGQCRYWIKNDYGADPESQGLVLEDMIAGCVDGFGSG